MTDRGTDVSGGDGGMYQSAASELGKPSVVIQQGGKGRARREVPCRRVGQLAFNETMFFVLEGDQVQGFVYLVDLRKIEIQRRKSFRHPLIGLVVGIACILGPISAFLGDPLGISGIFFAMGGCGFVSVLGIGAYTLFEVITSRNVPWLVVGTKDGERDFLLAEPLSAEQEQLVFAFDTVARAAKHS